MLLLRIFFIFFLFINISNAYAYIDPGTGSMLLQGLIGGITSVIALISIYYSKLKNIILSLFGKNKVIKQDSNPPVSKIKQDNF